MTSPAAWPAGKPPRLCVVETADTAFWTHRAHLGRAALEAGMEVHVLAPGGDRDGRIARDGFVYHELLEMSRAGTNPLGEARSIAEITSLYRAIRPEVAHHVALKAVLHGTIAARRAGVPAIVGSVTGLGYAFIPGDARRMLLREALCVALTVALRGSSAHTIFQNPDDLRLFSRRHIVSAKRTTLIAGSGVDTNRFSPSPEQSGVPVVLVGTRMLWDKGIGELIEAARLLRKRGVAFELRFAGTPDESNPASATEAQLRAWEAEGLIRWVGQVKDMARELANAHLGCLPSYREGLPLFLAEVAAAGLPAVTTDVPGCREVVVNRETGLLVPVRDPVLLADALQALLVDGEQRRRMGQKARLRALEHFSHERVVEQTFAIYRALLSERAAI